MIDRARSSNGLRSVPGCGGELALPGRAVRVVIVDRHRAIRVALCTLFEHEPGVDVVGRGERLDAVDAALRVGTVDAVLVDDGIAGVSTAATRAVLRQLSQRASVVVIGMGDPAVYAGAVIDAGAKGYWAKYGDLEILLALIQATSTPRQPPGTENALRSPRPRTQAAPVMPQRSPRRHLDSDSAEDGLRL